MSDVPLPSRLLYSVPSAAAALDLSASTVRRMIADDRIQVVRVGSNVRIPLAELERVASMGAQAKAS